MYPVSKAWEMIMGNNQHWFESKVVVNGEEFTQDKIMSMNTSYREFAEEHPSVGACLSAEMQVTMLRPTTDIPRMASVEPYIRALEAYKGGDPQTKTGSIISFNNPTGRVQIDAMSTTLTPQQSGSGTPSPDNIRPISGFSEVTVTDCGKNLFGGSVFADALEAVATSPTRDDVNKTITFTHSVQKDGDWHRKMFTFPRGLEGQVSIVIRYSNSGGRNTSLGLVYTDGTETQIALENSNGEKATYLWHSTQGKTPDYVQLFYRSDRSTTIYYEESGFVQGALASADGFVPYDGNTITVDLGEERYAGTVNLLTGEMTITHVGFDGGDVTWYKEVNNYRTFRTSIKTPLAAYVTNRATIMSSVYKSFSNSTASQSEDNYVFSQNTASNPFAAVKDTSKESLTGAQFQTAMEGVQFVYELAEPMTVQLTPEQLELVIGQNNVWSNTGNLTMTYQDRAFISEWIPQGKFWIDTREYTRNDDNLDLMTLHCFDSMLKTEDFYPDSNLQYPAIATDVVQLIASTIGVNVDQRTLDAMQEHDYTISLPAGYTMRETLSYIGAMYAGNWVMSYDGELLLVTLNSMPKETYYLVDNNGRAILFGGDRICV